VPVLCDGVEHRKCLQISADQYSTLADLPNYCLFLLQVCSDIPSGHIEYDKCNEVHEVVDNKLDKFEVTLNNKFSLLKDELTSLSDKIGNSVRKLTKLDNQIKGSMNQGLEKYNESMVATLDDRLNHLSKSETPGTNDKTNLPMKSFSQIATTIITK